MFLVLKEDKLINKTSILENIAKLDFSKNDLECFILGVLVTKHANKFCKIHTKTKDIFISIKSKIYHYNQLVEKFDENNLAITFKHIKFHLDNLDTIKKVQYFICGLFWASGSTTINENQIVIDLLIRKKNSVSLIDKFFTKFDMSTILINKSKYTIIRIKNKLSIANFFLFANCKKEAYKTFNDSANSEINRRIQASENLQISNQIKIIEASNEYIDAIKQSKPYKTKHFLSSRDTLIWNYRVHYPDMSIGELTKQINVKENLSLSKSTVYRSLRKAIKKVGN